MIDKEKVYDEEIFPLMEKIIDICNNHEIPLFTTFQYNDDGFCTTCATKESHSVFYYLDAIRQCIQDDSINIDKFIMWAMKRAKKTGHSSVILKHLDVPCTPRED